MGLFDKLGGNKEISLSPKAGLLLSAITMVAIDGDIDDDEVAIISRLDKNVGSKANDFDSALKVWKMNSIEECKSLVADTMNSKQQLTAIANLIDIAMADGILVGEEKDLLEYYLEAFEVNEEQAKQIVDVISIKNNQSIFE